MNLLIIDDEPKIRKGLLHHFEKSDFDFDVIETADNGLTALEKVRETKPDIILVDICMPGMDGLEFIETVSAELSRARIIVISGHDNFSFAQKALQCGVHDYVLKPIDLPQFDLLIGRVYDDLLMQAKRREHVSYALDAMDKNKETLINDLFTRILKGGVNPPEIEREADMIGIRIPDPAGIIVIKIANRLLEDTTQWELDLLRYAIQNIVDEICLHLDDRIFFTDAKYNTVLLYAYRDDIDYVSLMTEIHRTIENCVGYDVKIDVADVTDVCVNLPSVYEQMLSRLTHTNAMSQIVIEAKNYIAQNYHREDLTLQTVADAIRVNPSYISRLMRKQLGMNFTDYLTIFRMKKAVVLLVNCEKDVKLYEISQRLGYSSQHYFSRVFTKHYGISPMQYRMKVGAVDE